MIVIIILIIIGSSLLVGKHKNNTGSTEYKAQDVDLNCTYTSDDGNKNVTVYSDFIFNYKSSGKESYNYLLKVYNKKINT